MAAAAPRAAARPTGRAGRAAGLAACEGDAKAEVEAAAGSQGPPALPSVVNGRFELQGKLGSGSYSEVFLAVDRRSSDKVAVKVEWMHAEKGGKLVPEAQIYELLAAGRRATGAPERGLLPRMHWWGEEGEYNIMVMDLLGPSLENIFQSSGRRFTLKTTLMLGIQMLDCIEHVHACGINHRDIKPDNFLVGLGDQRNRLSIMDFGLAKRYLDPCTGAHILCAKKKGLTGTVRYTTLNVHGGFEPARRDDVGSICYVLLYFVRGRLPWQGINAHSKRTKQQKIGRRKGRVPHEELCEGFPHEFVEWLEYCDSLAYEVAPDYDRLRGLMRGALAREGWTLDFQFDWLRPSALQGGDGAKRDREGDALGTEDLKRRRGDGPGALPPAMPAAEARAAAAAAKAALEVDDYSATEEYSLEYSYEYAEESEEEEESEDADEAEESEEEEDLEEDELSEEDKEAEAAATAVASAAAAAAAAEATAAGRRGASAPRVPRLPGLRTEL